MMVKTTDTDDSGSFSLKKTLLGLGVFILLTGNILVLTNYLKPSDSMMRMEGMNDTGEMDDMGGMEDMMSVDGSSNPNPVRVETVESQVLEASVVYTGTIKPYQDVTVYPRVAGQLTNYSVYAGDRVTKGETIALIDASELNTEVAEVKAEIKTLETDLAMSEIRVDEHRSSIEEIKADLDYLRLKRDRFAHLAKEGAIPQDDFDVVASEVKSKEATLQQAQVGLKRRETQIVNDRAQINQAKAKLSTARVIENYTHIKAPISGIVQERNLDPGVVVQPSMGIVKLGDYSRVRLQANIAQQDATKIRLGSPIIAKISGSEIAPIKGKITSIFPQADPQTRTVTVEAVIDNSNGKLGAGQFLEMTIVTDRKLNVITIPQGAVVEFDNEPSVWVVTDNTVQARSIALGRSTQERVEVIDGLQEGETVVISGQSRLVEKAPVAVINQ